MIGSVTFEMDRLMKTLKDVEPVLKKDMTALVKQSMRKAIEKAIELTPPGGDVSGQAAKKRGEGAIVTDLFGGNRSSKGFGKAGRRAGIFFGVKESILTKFKRGNTDTKIKKGVREDHEILFRKKDGTVYATQQHTYRPNATISEMAAHHKRYFKNGRMTSSISGQAETGQWVFVDKFTTTKKNLDAFTKTLFAKVGIWAAGWMPAAAKVGARKTPAWIKRHTGRANGRCTITDTTTQYIIEAANSTGYRYGNLQRIVRYAIASARGSMIADAREKVMRQSLKKAGLKK